MRVLTHLDENPVFLGGLKFLPFFLFDIFMPKKLRSKWRYEISTHQGNFLSLSVTYHLCHFDVRFSNKIKNFNKFVQSYFPDEDPSYREQKQGRIHGYPSRVRVGRGHICGHQTIWGGAVGSQNKNQKKSKM